MKNDNGSSSSSNLLINIQKRTLDILASIFGLFLFSPFLIIIALSIWLYDRHNPFYFAERIGRDATSFRMIKFRTMVINADQTGVDSTSNSDKRITSIGKFLRRYKLDEIPQLWNVLRGHMSLVGPRPNVKREIDLYTSCENLLLTLRPGITDLASIVFADEGSILEGCPDPDIAYNQLIRPSKSKLGLIYVENYSLLLDLQILYLTLVSQINRTRALQKISQIVRDLGGSNELSVLALRTKTLIASPPPGSDVIVTSRD